ncbi:uncharacterized protein BCR38DRAFT_436534 [Pseudomassariella vexata]|uniref:Rhodopsin domain-containing protein n=1 Tax=Pseudomassariella vexata TaxID=1141098 RepID=A0A1Y2DVP1_9PEZI|nr:uncharacterized protein BCR38DRAFT_436534 [Pseudomassariella vexata]ORY63327.1 hypothetical protein BCR38DRAFT_436534 [Pseudomassariella vexata]
MATTIDPLTPAAPAPAGVTADFYSTSQLQLELLVVFGVTFGIATILLMLRLYTGLVLTKQLGWDAFFVVLSWLASLTFFIVMVIAFQAGFGRHLYNVNVGQLARYIELLKTMAITYIWPPTLAKVSLLFLYYRIDKHMGFRYCIPLAGFAVLAPTLIYTILFAGPCDPAKGDLQCLNKLAVSQAVTNIGTDAMLIAMPIHMIANLNMAMRQKITLGCLLAFGSFVVVFSIIRAAFVHSFVSDADITHTQAYVAIWGCLELNFGIICNCLAVLKPFLTRHMPWLARRITGTSGTRGQPRSKSEQTTTAFSMAKQSSRSHWRGDPGNHSYQLHSVGKSLTPDPEQQLSSTNKPTSRVIVTDEYFVDYSPKKPNGGDDSSTEGILEDSTRR